MNIIDSIINIEVTRKNVISILPWEKAARCPECDGEGQVKEQ